MSKLIKNILLSLAVFVGLSTSFTACGNQNNNNNSAVGDSNTTKPERETGNRKPQVNMGNNNTTEESVYKDGEIITLAEGTKLKYSADGNHEIIEKGEGTVLIFKKVTEEDLKKLEPETRAMVERQMATLIQMDLH